MKQTTKKRSQRSSYHVVVIPEDSSQVHRLRVRPWQTRLGLGLLIGLVLSLVFTTGGYIRYHSLYQRSAEMRARYAQVQQEQTRLAERLAQLEFAVKRAENMAGKVGSLVQVAENAAREVVGPVEEPSVAERLTEPFYWTDYQELEDLEDAAVAKRFDELLSELEDRALEVEEGVTAAYENYQDHLVHLSSTPDLWPVLGWLTSRFGPRHSPFGRGVKFHEGVDIAAPWGVPVRATADGVIRFVGYKGGLGKTVIIDHGFGIVSYYGHNSELHVKEGERVERGQVIAAVGNTGHSTGPHLHYEVHADGIPVDPMAFLPPRTTMANTVARKSKPSNDS